MGRQDAVEAHMIHSSLFRPVLFGGVEPPVVVLEVTTAFALIFGIGLHVATVLLAVFYLTAVHSTMAWVSRQDAHMTALYIRSLSARDFYFPHGSIHGITPRVSSSIPHGV